jgi:hypothetical protein
MIVQQHTVQSGYLLIMVLVFSSVLFTITASLIGFVVVQSKVVAQRVQSSQAGHIAEAGLNYYKWYLAHNPGDVTHGTGLPGPYIFPFEDPEGGVIGEYHITTETTQFCGEVNSIRVTSEGYTYAAPEVKRTMSARYARPTVADYAFILNSSVWAGPDRVITGPYHSNGGIRMDGRNESTVSSNLASWTCTTSFGCNPNSVRDGVFTTTANANTGLFSFPSPPVDFAGITVDLATIKARAISSGRYFAPSGNYGYRVVFHSNGTYTVQRVTNTAQVWGFSSEEDWVLERHIITETANVGTFPISSSCPVLFFEDKVWLEGTVRDKVTIAAANLISPATPRSIIINNDITYVSATSSGLLAIAQQNILLGLVIPNTLYINGIYIAQNGRYGRNYYCPNNSNPGCNNSRRLPEVYQSFNTRSQEIMNGTIVSNGRVGTQWVSGGVSVSGFLNRINSYDRLLATDPPAFIPTTSDVYQFQEWRDE